VRERLARGLMGTAGRGRTAGVGERGWPAWGVRRTGEVGPQPLGELTARGLVERIEQRGGKRAERSVRSRVIATRHGYATRRSYSLGTCRLLAAPTCRREASELPGRAPRLASAIG
jgi:hypothetical protein